MITAYHSKTNLMKCTLHTQYYSEFLYVVDKTGDPFRCFLCIRDQELAVANFVHIQEIFESSQESSRKILYNYPPTNSPTVQQKLKEIKFIATKDGLYDQVQQYFNDLQSEFNQAIEKAKSQVKKQIIEVADFKEEFFKKYTEISSIFEINQLLGEGKEGMKKKISDILQQKVAETDKNTEILSDLLCKNKAIDEGFSMVHPKQIAKNVIALLSRIDFFQGKREKIESEPLNQGETQKVQQTANPGQSSTQILMELIENPTNYCSKKLLSSVQQVFSDLDFYMSQHSFGDNLVDQQKRSSFKCLNQEQLEDIRVLSEKIGSISNLQKSNQPAKETTGSMGYYPKTQEFVKYLNNLSKSDLKEITSLLKSYPIFEMVESNFCQPLFYRVNIIQSSFQSSHTIQIQKNDQHHIEVKSCVRNDYKVAYSDFIVDPTKKYIFRVHLSAFQEKPYNFIVFGLLDDNQKNSNYLHSHNLSYCEISNDFGISQVIRGKALHSDNQQNVDRFLEMRIFLKDKIVKVSDFPKYENVCQLNDISRINLSINYRFGIEFHNQNTTLTITDILEVPEFDSKM